MLIQQFFQPGELSVRSLESAKEVVELSPELETEEIPGEDINYNEKKPEDSTSVTCSSPTRKKKKKKKKQVVVNFFL